MILKNPRVDVINVTFAILSQIFGTILIPLQFGYLRLGALNSNEYCSEGDSETLLHSIKI